MRSFESSYTSIVSAAISMSSNGFNENALFLRLFLGVGIASSTFANRGWNRTRDWKVKDSRETSFFRGVFAGVGRTALEDIGKFASSISVSEEAGDNARTLCFRGVGADRFPNLGWEREMLCDGDIGEEGGDSAFVDECIFVGVRD
jgi:hypothetical protein